MDTIRAYIFASTAAENPAQAKQLESDSLRLLADQLSRKALSLGDLLEALSPYITDRRFDANRLKSHELLSLLLKRLPANFLTEAEVVLLFKILSKALESDVVSVRLISSSILTLKMRFKASKSANFLRLLLEFFAEEKFSTVAYVQEVRADIYQVVLCSFSEALQSEELERQAWLTANQHALLSALVSQTEGEKDPRNLVLVLEIWELALSRLSPEKIGAFAAEIFELLSVYFPITFENQHSKILVDRNYLNELLLGCLTKEPLLPKFLELILDKLNEEDKEEKAAVMENTKALLARMSEWELSELGPVLKWLERLRKRLDLLLFESNDAASETSAKAIYEAFVRFLAKRCRKNALIDWSSLANLRSVLDKFCLEMKEKPNGKNSLLCFSILDNTVVEFETPALLEFLIKLAQALEHLIAGEKYSALIVFIENALPLTFKIYFNPFIFEARTNVRISEESARKLIHLCFKEADFQKQKSLLKCLVFLIRTTSAKIPVEELVFHLGDKKMSIIWDLGLLERRPDGPGDIAEFALAMERKTEVLESILFYNFSCPDEAIFKLYLHSAEEHLSSNLEEETKGFSLETFENLAIFIKKRLAEVNFEFEHWTKYLEKMRELFKKESLKFDQHNEKTRKKFKGVLISSLLFLFKEQRLALLRLFSPLEKPDFWLLKRAALEFSNCLQNLNLLPLNSVWLENKDFCKFLALAIEQNQFLMDEDIFESLSQKITKKEFLIYILSAMLKINFERFSSLLEKIIRQMIERKEFGSFEFFIEFLMKAKTGDKFQSALCSPLFNQKLVLFLHGLLEKIKVNLDDELYFSVQLEIYEYKVANKMIDKKELGAFIEAVKFFLQANKNCHKIFFRFILFVEKLVDNKMFEIKNFEEKEIEVFFNFFGSEKIWGLALLAKFLVVLDKIICLHGKDFSRTLQNKIFVSLKKIVGHRKRILRKLAGIALNDICIYLSN